MCSTNKRCLNTFFGQIHVRVTSVKMPKKLDIFDMFRDKMLDIFEYPKASDRCVQTINQFQLRINSHLQSLITRPREAGGSSSHSPSLSKGYTMIQVMMSPGTSTSNWGKIMEPKIALKHPEAKNAPIFWAKNIPSSVKALVKCWK